MSHRALRWCRIAGLGETILTAELRARLRVGERRRVAVALAPAAVVLSAELQQPYHKRRQEPSRFEFGIGFPS